MQYWWKKSKNHDFREGSVERGVGNFTYKPGVVS